jgi:hypothetical protein
MTARLSIECIQKLINIGKSSFYEKLLDFVDEFPEHRSGQLTKLRS